MRPAIRCSSIIPGQEGGNRQPGLGVVRDAEIFGVLGASSYAYVEASFTRALPDWIGAHARMFRFFGGVPHLVPDNLRRSQGIVLSIAATA